MKTAFAYIGNAGYLVPALVSGIGARRNLSTEAADVVIVDMAKPNAEGEAVAEAAAAHGVRYVRVDPEVLEGLHVQASRLYMHRFLPAEYNDFVYIDADTQVWGRLDELAAAPVALGQVLGALDPMALMAASGSKLAADWSAYMASIGLDGRQTSYVNSGVLKAERKGWAAVGEEAAKLLKSGKRYTFMDQDVINIVARDSIKLISLKWNFPGFYLKSGTETQVTPRLVHFMGNPRPWHGSFFPWGPAGINPYVELSRSHPELEKYWPKLKPLRYLKYVAQQQYKRVMETPNYRAAPLREALRQSEATLAL